MVQLVDTAVASIKNHNEAIDGLAKVTQDQDARIRTLQSQVYALKEENESLKRGLENLGTTVGNLCKSYMLHSHEAGNA
jgi:chaperonin cofactor prefoldin